MLSTKGVTNLELGDYLGECSRRTEQRRARLGLDGRSGGLPSLFGGTGGVVAWGASH